MLTLVILLLNAVSLTYCQFTVCHDDAAYEIREGPISELIFTWLGTLQYIHIKKGTPNYFRVPRVILISRQFALTTAFDAAVLPDGFALGNVVFGDYERDEDECHVTIEDIAKGADCDPAILVMPIADVIVHPEFRHFNIKNSVALLKLVSPLKSQFMVPVCLPTDDLLKPKVNETAPKLYHIDFVSEVPRDFDEEDREVVIIEFLENELCNMYAKPGQKTDIIPGKEACSTSCGFHSGSPTIVHEKTGHFTVMAISEGGSACPDPALTRQPNRPPRHILLRPYVPWITAAITGTAGGDFDKNNPFGYVMPQARLTHNSGKIRKYIGWVGHWWLGGLRCYDRGEAAVRLFRFYHETFQIHPQGDNYWEYYLEIAAMHSTKIICVKVWMPYKLGDPRVWNLDHPVVYLRIPLAIFSVKYHIQIEAWGFQELDELIEERKDCEEPEFDFPNIKEIYEENGTRWGE